jgi:hypothetical protein
MVETGHGTEDNFTGQVMKRKGNLQQNLYVICSVAARCRPLFIHMVVYFFIYLLVYLFIYSLFHNAVTITGYLAK